MHAAIRKIAYYLPECKVDNIALSREFPDWGAERIAEKTGIVCRHIASEGELSSDLAFKAAQKLFSDGAVAPDQIDFLLFCTQTPDFSLPTTACLLQRRLGLSRSIGALDFNLGCSGFVYGLSLAKGLIESGQAKNVLLLTGETYSKLIDPKDKSVRTIFGDAGAATLLSAVSAEEKNIVGPFVFGTDGAGGANLICHQGGWRGMRDEAQGRDALWMNGPEIFNFTIAIIPEAVKQILLRVKLSKDEIDLFVFHQANQYMLTHIKKKLDVPDEKFVVEMAHCGNTVSSTIPIALVEAEAKGKLKTGMNVMLMGFGVGYSWAVTIVRWI